MRERNARVTAGNGPADEPMASDQHLPSIFVLHATLASEVRACVGFFFKVIMSWRF